MDDLTGEQPSTSFTEGLASVVGQQMADHVTFDAHEAEQAPTRQSADPGYIRELYRTIPGLGEFNVKNLTPETVDLMMMNGQVQFAFWMKVAPLAARFLDRNTWRFRCSDDALRIKAEFALKRFFFFSILDILNAPRYGASYNEVIWEPLTAENLGITDRKVKKSEIIWVPRPMVNIHPGAVTQIRYTTPTETKPKEFNGFDMLRSDGRAVTIKRESALILTHNKHFGDLTGQSILTPVYPFWYFYEQVWRSALRFFERVGQPLVVVHYPSRGTITDKNGKTMPASEYALYLAEHAATRTAIAIPSDVDDHTRTERWKIEFLTETNRSNGAEFIDALKQIETQIGRGMLLGDLVATNNANTGSYKLGETHMAATSLDTEMRLLELVAQIERYFLPKFARYNSDKPNVQITIETEALNQTDRAIDIGLMQMLLQIHPDSWMIDLRAIAEKLGFPVKDESADLPVQMQSMLQPKPTPGGEPAEENVPKVETKEENGQKTLSIDVSPDMAYSILSNIIKTSE